MRITHLPTIIALLVLSTQASTASENPGNIEQTAARKQQKPKNDLFAPLETVEVGSVSKTQTVEFEVGDDASWSLRGRFKNRTGTVILRPKGSHWDFSAFSSVRIDVTNAGPGPVWIKGRLDNQGAPDWGKSTASAAFSTHDAGLSLLADNQGVAGNRRPHVRNVGSRFVQSLACTENAMEW